VDIQTESTTAYFAQLARKAQRVAGGSLLRFLDRERPFFWQLRSFGRDHPALRPREETDVSTDFIWLIKYWLANL
jgi:hypothetical protein